METVTVSRKFTEDDLRFLPASIADYIRSNDYEVPPGYGSGIRNEINTQKYNLQRQRNDPDAMYGSPEYSRESTTDSLLEAIGRLTEPKSIYNIVDPVTRLLFSEATGGAASYRSDLDELTLPAATLYMSGKADPEIEAHEYIHRGLRKNPIKDLTPINEHLYIGVKTGNDKLVQSIKDQYLKNIPQEEFQEKLNLLVSQIDRIAERQNRNRLDELYD